MATYPIREQMVALLDEGRGDLDLYPEFKKVFDPLLSKIKKGMTIDDLQKLALDAAAQSDELAQAAIKRGGSLYFIDGVHRAFEPLADKWNKVAHTGPGVSRFSVGWNGTELSKALQPRIKKIMATIEREPDYKMFRLISYAGQSRDDRNISVPVGTDDPALVQKAMKAGLVHVLVTPTSKGVKWMADYRKKHGVS